MNNKYIEQLGVRFNYAQKKRFIEEIKKDAEMCGYETLVYEKRIRFSKVRNVIVGNVKSAKTVYMVPYDTPAKVFWPNYKFYPLAGRYFMNKNFLPVYGPLLLAYVFLLFLVYVVPNYLSIEGKAILFILSFIYLFLLLKMIFTGFANKNNAQRNSAGITLLCEIMQEKRKDVAFVFMDHSSSKGYGSNVMKEYFTSISKNPFKIVLNCIGSGDSICIGHVKGSRKEAIDLSKKVKGITLKSMDQEDVQFTPLESLDNIVCISSGKLEKNLLCVYKTCGSKDIEIDETIYNKVKKIIV